MFVYFVKRAPIAEALNHRVSGYHSTVFHGWGDFPGRREWGRGGGMPPSVTNTNREPLHVSRSGTFVPPVFCGMGVLVVSATVRERLQTLPNVEFVPVVFEHLVELAMPALGDFSLSYQRDPQTMEWRSSEAALLAAPDVPTLHDTIGPYYHLLGLQTWDVKDEYPDYGPLNVNFGTYPGFVPAGTTSPGPVDCSLQMLEQYPVVRCGNGQMLREDAFALLAPFLNLDFFSIACHIVDKRTDAEKAAGREKWRRSLNLPPE
jgi:hypothetical protein